MEDDESLSSNVRVFMIEKEALWYEFEHLDSQQGSSSEGNFWTYVPTAKALSQTGVRLSGGVTEVVDSEETEVVYFEELVMGEVSPGYKGVEPDIES